MRQLLPIALSLLALSTPAFAEDWPTYKHDSARSGGTTAELGAPLHLVWEYSAPAAPQLAWDGPRAEAIEGHFMRNRTTYDEVLHTVSAGGRTYFGSSVDHQIYCLDTATGRVIWRVFTEGDVRLAPTLAEGRLYVGSDDGVMYCLATEDGREIWRRRIAPRDERLLARGGLISRCRVRSGVLVEDGIVYCGAGVFPHETVYLAALKADTGEIVWLNDAISQQDAGRNDLSPQGYLLMGKKALVVPSGRALPVGVDRRTGEILHQEKYAWRSSAGGVVGGTRALLVDGQIYCSGDHHFLAIEEGSGRAGHAYIPGREVAVAGDDAYFATGSALRRVKRAWHAMGSAQRQEWWFSSKTLRGEALAIAQKKMKELEQAGVAWEVATPHDAALIATADCVALGGDREVVVFDAASGERLWAAAVEGRVGGLAALPGRLMVSTDAGKIYCFTSAAPAEVVQIPGARSENPYPADELTPVYAAAAREILAESGCKSGFCLVAGGGEGRLAYELARNSELLITVLEDDAARIGAARTKLEAAGLYGTRVVILQGTVGDRRLPNFFADLVTSDTLVAEGRLPCQPADLARLVKPCGGVVCFGRPEAAPAIAGYEPEKARGWLEQMYVNEDVKIAFAAPWAKLTRGQLSGVGEWSHQYGNVGNTSLSNDERVKGGLGVLWYGDPGPRYMINRHEAAAAPLSVGGRMFIQGTDRILAYDAYNGRFLWECENPGALRTGVFNNQETSNLAASEEALYVCTKNKCTQYEAATGKVLREFTTPPSPDGLERDWGYVAVDQGVLYGSSTLRTDLERAMIRRGLTVKSATDAVFAVDPKTGETKWIHRGENILHVTIALGEGRMYFIDSSLSESQREEFLAQDKSRFQNLPEEERAKAEAELKKIDVRRAVALDAATGEVLWSKPIDVTNCTFVSAGGGNLSVMHAEGKLVITGANANGHYWRQFLAGDFSQRKILVLNAATGEKLWSRDANYMNRPAVIGNRIIAEPWSFDLATGEESKRVHPLTGEETPWRFSRPGHHCGVITATPNMMFFRSGFIGYYDLYEDDGTQHFAGQRLGCWVNAIPAGGLVVIPEASAGCVCLFSIASTVVLEPRTDRDSWGIYSAVGEDKPVRKLALNLGAPGDRRDQEGTVWFAFPRPKAVGRLEYVFDIGAKFAAGGDFVDRNAERLEIDDHRPWLHASAARGFTGCKLELQQPGSPKALYTVKLHFTELEARKPGDCRFDLSLGGKRVAEGIDVAEQGGTPTKPLVLTYSGIEVGEALEIELTPKTGALPAVSAIEVVRE